MRYDHDEREAVPCRCVRCLATMLEREESPPLFGKYIIRKASGEPVDRDAFYFVLRVDTDSHARVALRAYAESVRADNPVLAADLDSALAAVEAALRGAP